MSKMGSWVLEMQEAGLWMTREEFVAQYGASQVHVWDNVNSYIPEWDGEPLEDGADEA